MARDIASPDENLPNKPRGFGNIYGAIGVGVALLVILGASVWLTARTWISTPGVEINVHGYIAMVLGIVFSLVVGCGLMGLVFYSSRYGYDDQQGPQNPK
jgi:hypothetical protein